MNRSVRGAESVKRFERSNGLYTALYTNYNLFSLQAGTPANAREASRPRVDARRDGSHFISDSRRRSDRSRPMEAATLQVVPGARIKNNYFVL